MEEKSKRDLDTIISEEHLKPTETYQFIDDSFEQGEITTTGVGITRILPPMPVIGAKGKREAKKQTTPSPQIKPPSSPSTASSGTTTAPTSWLLMMEGKLQRQHQILRRNCQMLRVGILPEDVVGSISI